MNARRSFSRWVSRLYIQVQQLDQKVRKARSKYDAIWLEKEVNTRVANLEHLYAFASQHEIDVCNYHDKLLSIKDTLKSIEVRLKHRKRPWWKKVWQAVRKAIPILSPLLSIFVPFLQPLLGPWGEKIVALLGDGTLGDTVRGLLGDGGSA